MHAHATSRSHPRIHPSLAEHAVPHPRDIVTRPWVPPQYPTGVSRHCTTTLQAGGGQSPRNPILPDREVGAWIGAGRLNRAEAIGERGLHDDRRVRGRKGVRDIVGRAGLLARLDQLLVDSATDRWVVITGGPGMGKSALLAAWLSRREAAGVVVPHHFIRRGAYDWDDPAELVDSLVAQIEDGFPGLREPDGDERMHPATRLARRCRACPRACCGHAAGAWSS
jgi:hypothetical protein